MTDRELLDLAAKAAGIVVHAPGQKLRDDIGYGHVGLWTEETTCWNPLTDDGDALRLACHLFMSVSTGPVEASANTIAGALRGQFFRESTIDELDTAAAVRRAIVRAAAEIGRSAS